MQYFICVLYKAMSQRAQDRLSKICSHLTAQEQIHSLSVQLTSGADVSSLAKKSDIFKIHPAVKQALDEGKPVVALESTVLTHGLPYPQNEQVGKSLEQKVREQGAIPATIGVVKGVIYIGLEASQVEYLCREAGSPDIIKATTRDIAYAVSTRRSAGTTVAATCTLAHMAGIRVFATGGIGGVHRDGHVTMDVSADLIEMSRVPVAVVCAGAKSILDLPRTLEVLETQGVTVIGYRSDDFPAFYTRSSGLKVPYRADTARQCAELLWAKQLLSQNTGTLVTQPIAAQDEAEAVVVDKAIQEAVKLAEQQHVIGNKVTPFILGHVNKVTSGHAMKSNIALLQQNAQLAAQIAVEFSKVAKEQNQLVPQTLPKVAAVTAASPAASGARAPRNKVIVAGGLVCDVIAKMTADGPAKYQKEGPQHASTNNSYKGQFEGLSVPGHVTFSPGGVGRNIAEAIVRLLGPQNVIFTSVTGNPSSDPFSKLVLDHMTQLGMNTNYVNVLDKPGLRTPLYHAALYPNGELKIGINCMEMFDHFTPEMIYKQEEQFKSASIVVVDSNIPEATIAAVCQLAQKYKVPVLYEPTSVFKCEKVIKAKVLDKITYIVPNFEEVKALAYALKGTHFGGDVKRCAHLLLEYGVKHVIVKLGPNGVFVASHDKTHLYCPALPPKEVVNVTGAGDCMVAGLVYGLQMGMPLVVAVQCGMHTARQSIESAAAVPETLSLKNVLVPQYFAARK